MRPFTDIQKRWILLGVIVLGTVLRLQLYFIGRGLWLDEAMLAVGIIRYPLPMISHLLDYRQQAAVGYVLLTKLASVLFGDGPMALRLPSILPGLALLPLIVYIVRRLDLRFSAQLLGVVLVAFNPYLISYANEVKQYSLDALMAAAVFGVFVSDGRWRTPGLVLLLTAGVFFSHPLVFVAAAALVAEWIRLGVRDGRMLFRRILPMGALLLLFFAAHYFLFVRQSIDAYHEHWYTMNYHRDFFMPLTFWKLETLLWFPRSATRFMTHLMYFHLPLVGLLLLGAGVIHGLRSSKLRASTVLLVLSIVFAALASSLQLYTLKTPRMMLYAMPLMAVLFAFGLQAVLRMEKARMFVQAATVLVFAVAVLPPLGIRAWRMTDTLRYGYREEVREVFPIWMQEKRPGDGTYVHYRVQPIVHYNCIRTGTVRDYPVHDYIPDEHLADSLIATVGVRGWAFFSNTDLAYQRIQGTLDARYRIRYSWSHDSSAVLLRLEANEE